MLNRKRNSSPRQLSSKRILAFLDLPSTSTYDEAAVVLKKRIIRARKSDDASAAHLSEFKAILWRSLPRKCDCGKTVKPRSIRCLGCANALSYKDRFGTHFMSTGASKFVREQVEQAPAGGLLFRKTLTFLFLEQNPKLHRDQARDGIGKYCEMLVNEGRLQRIQPGIYRKL